MEFTNLICPINLFWKAAKVHKILKQHVAYWWITGHPSGFQDSSIRVLGPLPQSDHMYDCKNLPLPYRSCFGILMKLWRLNR